MKNSKKYIWIGAIMGSILGSFIPNTWGTFVIPFPSVVFSAILAIVGAYVGIKLDNRL